MSVRTRTGKAIILALFPLFIASCDGSPLGEGSPFGGGGREVSASALQSAVAEPAARAFYQARQWQAAWDGKNEKQLVEIIGGAMAHGLKPSLFLKEPLPDEPTDREAALTKGALAYASALARGHIDPTKLGVVYTIPRPKADVAAGLAEALEQGNLQDWFESLVPQTDEYRALSEAHLAHVQRTAQARAAPVPEGKALKPGQRDPRLAVIAAALRANGYLPPPAQDAPPPQRYTPEMVAAVRRLQADYGMKPDAVVGPATLGALNSGPAGRARQIAVALERLRWLDRSPPATRIDVNTAATFLEYWRDGRRVDQRRVVVGEPGWETPQLQSPMFQLVANPMWRVPDSILEDELAGASARYLARNGFEWRNGRLVQRSGPKNSLGLVKFDMRNGEHIYLHDTPAKALFAQPDRHKSHGCVRVEGALDFAAVLAGQDGILDDFMEDLRSGDEKYLKLKTEIPVRLLYHTAFWDGARVQFRADPYGWDDNVARALGFERGPDRKPYLHKKGDVAP